MAVSPILELLLEGDRLGNRGALAPTPKSSMLPLPRLLCLPDLLVARLCLPALFKQPSSTLHAWDLAYLGATACVSCKPESVWVP